MTKRETARRQQWLAAYESALTAAVPELSGKVDWDTAIYFFNQGHDAAEAAARMAQRWKDHDHE